MASADLYLYLNGETRGPFSEEQLRSYLAHGLLRPSDLVSENDRSSWKKLASLGPGAVLPVASPAVVTSEVAPDVSRPAEAPVLPESLGPYVRSTLSPNESPVYQTSLHWIIFARFAFFTLLAFLIAMPFAIFVQALTGSQLGWFALPLPTFLMVAPTLAYVSSELVITNSRVLIKTGIVRRQTLEMFVTKIESIAIEQGFLARIFDYGTVIIRGTGGFEEPFETIAHPIEFRNWVQRMQKGEVIA